MRRAKNPNYVQFSKTETVVAFTSDRGVLRRNDHGDFFLRYLSDGRFTCCGEDLERRLLDIHYRAGEQVGITRALYNRSVIWKVRRIREVTTIAHANGAAKANGIPDSKYARPEPPAIQWEGLVVNAAADAVVERIAPAALGASSEPEAQAQQNITATAQRKPQQASLIMRCARTAVEAAAEASALAKELGLDVTLGASEIQALISTLYIQAAGARR